MSINWQSIFPSSFNLKKMREETKSEENKQKIMVHEEQKCKSCDKSFSQARDLKKHIHTVHEGYRESKCDICGRSFSEVGSLNRHIQTIHEGQNNYKCQSSGKSFSRADYLRKHIHTVHEGQNITNVNLVTKHFLKQEV